MTDNIAAFDPTGELDARVTPTPLSDPVITAIFQNADVSGLAMRSLLNATLDDSGDSLVSEVVSVTPQSVHTDTSMRGFRIDVEAKTAKGEIALVEVQLKLFRPTIERALLYSEQALASCAKRGDDLEQVTSSMPRVIVVNILEKSIRDVGGFHQVVELAYREPPYQCATDRLAIHNLELDKYRKTEIDNLTNPLRCWLTAICISQNLKKPLMEVVKMKPELQDYYDEDPGFAQFVDRHGVVAAMPEVRRAYRRWEYDLMLDRLDEERRAEQHEIQLLASEAKGEAKSQMKIALIVFAGLGQGMGLSEIIETLKRFEIPDEIIEAARMQTVADME